MFTSIATVIMYSLMVLFPVLVPAGISIFGAIAEWWPSRSLSAGPQPQAE
ncbi:hypothetical protein [Mycobacterium pseudokansasii]|nr:hypothetical protein [Mycobacterium pseudokansasii]VAZ96664.1 hypothetical protein LAUMK35_03421 [Mycobacterium pseudokansasii]VAZ98089.1 hypothetical protein LAUMK21_03418 [Mycobacterium pseudokansasii]